MYVPREAFDYPHREIAEILDITEAASQQIFHRAKKHITDGKARLEIDEAFARIVEEFLAAGADGLGHLVAPGGARGPAASSRTTADASESDLPAW